MATSTAVRDHARANGYENLSAKGKIPADAVRAWNKAHPDDPYEPDRRGPVTEVPDYPDDDFATAFAEIPPDDPGDTGESAPRKPPAKRAGTGWRFGRKAAPKGKKRPRTSTEKLCGGIWRGLAGIARPLPPLHRTLRIQAPVAGMILDDAVKDTVIDPLLQPLARLAGAGTAIAALAGPPVFVTAISLEAARAEAQQRPPNPVLMTIATEGLRSSLMAWLDVAGPKFEEALKREREFESKYGRSVDDMIAWLFSPPADPEAEEANIRRAQGLRDDDHAGM